MVKNNNFAICSPGFASVKNSCKENFGFGLAEVYNSISDDIYG